MMLSYEEYEALQGAAPQCEECTKQLTDAIRGNDSLLYCPNCFYVCQTCGCDDAEQIDQTRTCAGCRSDHMREEAADAACNHMMEAA